MPKPFTILVVDDFEPFRQFVCSMLHQRAEFQVAEASDGPEAVRKAEQLKPHLILLDIGLPNLNGIEVSRCACKVAPAAKILFLSQECSPDVVRGALGTGAYGYLPKVSAGRDLLSAIDVVLKSGCFVVSSVLRVPSTEAVTEMGTWKYPWQQKVMEALESARESLPIKINMAEGAIATRLCDPNLTDQERLDLKRALRSLRVLLDEVKTGSRAKDERRTA